MLYNTRGIALNYIRFRESSIIAKVYTEQFGIQSYIVNGVRSSKSKGNKIALFQPLTLLDLVVYHKNKQDTVHRISEMKCYHPFSALPYEVVKSSLALFITEILGRGLREEESNPPLFQFIEDSVIYLDDATTGLENFHIYFLLQLARYLGFGVENAQDLHDELLNNRYSNGLDQLEASIIEELMAPGIATNIKIRKGERATLLEKLVFFYKIHLDSLGEIKSMDVLREVLR